MPENTPPAAKKKSGIVGTIEQHPIISSLILGGAALGIALIFASKSSASTNSGTAATGGLTACTDANGNPTLCDSSGNPISLGGAGGIGGSTNGQFDQQLSDIEQTLVNMELQITSLAGSKSGNGTTGSGGNNGGGPIPPIGNPPLPPGSGGGAIPPTGSPPSNPIISVGQTAAGIIQVIFSRGGNGGGAIPPQPGILSGPIPPIGGGGNRGKPIPPIGPNNWPNFLPPVQPGVHNIIAPGMLFGDSIGSFVGTRNIPMNTPSRAPAIRNTRTAPQANMLVALHQIPD